jgi:N-ethylmaleimide reductase
VGRISHPSLQPGGALPVAPSAISPEGQIYTYQGLQPFVTPRALETGEIAGVVAQYGHGARMALEAGFDGVEIHGANGYLIDQFLRDGTNKRTDRYGGSLENRARFLLEVTDAVVKVWGGDRVGVRFSPQGAFNSMGDTDPSRTFGYAAEALNRFGLAYLHTFEDGAQREGGAAPAMTRILRKAFRGALIVNGGYDLATGNAVISAGTADLVAFAKAYISNPDLVERFRLGATLAPADPATFYSGGAKGYIDYPALSVAA